MKVLASLLLIGIVAVGAVSVAQAQAGGNGPNGTGIPEPIVLRLGVEWPNDAATRTWAGYAPVYAGIDYAIGQTGPVGTSISSLYLDYWGGAVNGGDVNVYGFGLSDRVYATPAGGTPGQTGQQYFTGGGFGAYQISDSNGNGTVFGVKLFGGVEFSQKVILQLGYNLLPAKTGLNPSGFNLQLGLRM
ncbi:MAG: hypothetical protein P4L33_02880 [Capsulimonadaceae bacterium]|nr:hypothetical protein [Capsulimonadaceae bacterium]